MNALRPIARYILCNILYMSSVKRNYFNPQFNGFNGKKVGQMLNKRSVNGH